MKRNIFLVLLLFFTIVCAYGQNASPIDLVLLLDTSSTMSSSYDNVNNYVTGAFLNEFLRVGDTFHLIAFSSSPRLDVARRISGVGDVETIIGRMLLQYPVENGSNISSALNFAEQYITTLPSRPKKIVLVSVGGSDTANVVNASKQRLNSKNTTLDFIQVTPGTPISNAPKSGRPAAVKTTTTTTTVKPTSSGGAQGSQTRGTNPPSTGTSAVTPSDTGGTTPTTGTTNTGTGTTTGTTNTSTGTTTGTANTGTNQTGGAVTPSSTGTTAAGETSSTAQGQNSSGSTTDRQTDDQSSGTSSAGNYDTDSKDTKNSISAAQRAKNRNESYSTSLPFFLFIIIIALLLLGLIIFLATRKLGSSPNRVMAEVASADAPRPSNDPTKFVDHSKDLAKFASAQGGRRTTPYDSHPLKPDTHKAPVINPSGPLLLNLFVEDQNTAIGKRNIHSLKSGYSLSVGGGKSDDYLIFLVPIPAHIGEIRRSGSSLTFVPRKPKYFPDIGSNEVKDCINKTIRIVSDKNYEMRFRFEMYEDPLVALNRVLMSFKIPG
jgi:hypothetical protein